MHHRLLLVVASLAFPAASQMTLVSISPPSAIVGGPGFTLSLTGSGFASTNVVLWDGGTLATTFSNSTHLTAAVPAALIATAGTATVRVRQLLPTPTFSNSLVFSINNPAPVLATVTPSTLQVGAASTTLTITGSAFSPATVARIGSTDLSTTFVSSTVIQAVVPGSLTSVTGNVQFSIFNPAPGGGTSSVVSLSVQNPLPVLSSISPNQVGVGNVAVTIVASGSGFVPGSTVRLGAGALSTTFVSSTQLSAILPASALGNAGTSQISVTSPTPGGGTSLGQPFTVTNPAPTLSSATPTVVPAGTATTLTLVGTGFNAQTAVQADGGVLQTFLVSSTQLTAIFVPSIAGVGNLVAITVVNPSPGGGTTAAQTLAIGNPIPLLSIVTPPTVTATTTGFGIAVIGSRFVPTSTVQWDSTTLSTTFVNSQQLLATVPPGFATIAAAHTIAVFSPAPAGGVSSTRTLTVENPVPTLTSIEPAAVAVGTPALTMSIVGADFVPSSSALVDGVPVTTTFIDSSSLIATVPASALLDPAVRLIAVSNPTPGGGVTAALSLTAVNAIPSITSVSAVQPPLVVDGPETLSIAGSGFHDFSVAKLDGAALATTFAGSLTGPATLTATVPANFLGVGGPHQLTVFNSGNGEGESAPVTIVFENPHPVIASLSQASIPGGSTDTTVVVNGSGFVTSTVATLSGSPVASLYFGPGTIHVVVPAALERASRQFSLGLTNSGPGGGSTSTPLLVTGPVVASVVPAAVPVLAPGSTPVSLTVTGGPFQPSDTIHLNGAAFATNHLTAPTLTCTLDPNVLVVQSPGGFALTVVRSGTAGLVASNAVGVAVGSPDNAGTVTLAPRAPPPGQGFNVRAEFPVGSVPFTLLAEIPAPTALLLSITPSFELALGPGLASPIVLVDGLGLFGPASGAVTAPDDLSVLGGPAARSLFEIPGLVAPSPPLGTTFSLAAIFADPSSPIGLNVTHIGGPHGM